MKGSRSPLPGVFLPLLVLALLLAVACGPAATPTPTPQATATPTMTPTAKVTGPRDIPRNRSLRLMHGGQEGKWEDYGTWNPLAVVRPYADEFIYEPLAFYNALGDITTMWLATSYEYNSNYTELTVKIRPGVQWSDGEPFTARDVAYTINTLRDRAPALSWSIDMKREVKEATAVDAQTVRISLNNPSPRFFSEYLTYHFDIGILIVPEHIYKNVTDVASFTHLDLAKGWPVGTSAYRVVASTPEQKVLDRRDDWWAVKTGFAKLPEVQRVVILPLSDETKGAQLVATNEVDAYEARPPAVIKRIIDQNPLVTTHTGRKSPYGYVDWWPFGISFNDSQPPFNSKDVRWAISYAINRQELVDIAYQGANEPSPWNLPPYKKLEDYRATIKDLFVKYPTTEFNLDKSAERMKQAGYTKGSDGIWKDASGKRFKFTIYSWWFALEETPLIVRQLQKAGFDVDFATPPDVYTRMQLGTADAYIFGHGGSVSDPYFTFRIYHSRFSAPTGQPSTQPYRWSNAEYDRLVDEMAMTPPDDPKMLTLLRAATEIWLDELPDLPLIQNYHRIPSSQKYWKNWPSQDNLYMNGSWWHNTALFWVYQLKAAE